MAGVWTTSPTSVSFLCLYACLSLTGSIHLLMSRALFPDLHWVVLSAKYHSTVACLDERLQFDLNYGPSALDVSASSAIEMMLKGDEGLEVFDDEQGHPNVMNEKTNAAVEFFGLADGTDTRHEELLAGFREAIADARADEFVAC